jgi:hypothetical protein
MILSFTTAKINKVRKVGKDKQQERAEPYLKSNPLCKKWRTGLSLPIKLVRNEVGEQAPIPSQSV